MNRALPKWKPERYEEKQKSLTRTIERYEGTQALLATWEPVLEPHHPYLKELRYKLQKLKSQIKIKGIYE